MRITAGRLLTLADQAATFLFAVEGALAAVLVGLDLFGILVIAFVTALVGGIIRDLLIGSTPPASLRGASYPTIAFAGAFLVFGLHQAVQQLPTSLLLCWLDVLPAEVSQIIAGGVIVIRLASVGVWVERLHGNRPSWRMIAVGLVSAAFCALIVFIKVFFVGH